MREPAVLKELREETKKLTGAIMQISPEQGQFMALLVELLHAKKTLDVGTFTGYSALVVALALPQDGKVISCDVNPETTKVARTFWERAGVIDKIDLRLAPALQTLEDLLAHNEAGTFDFIFIDADKNNYIHYYEKALMLLRTGGLVAIDNVLWDGKVAEVPHEDATTKTIHALNELIHQDNRVSISMLPVGDGLTLARKK